MIAPAGTVWSRPFLFSDRYAAIQAQSFQAQPAAAAHSDPAAGDRAKIPGASNQTPDGDTAITQFPHAHGDHFHLGDATVRASDATGLENENVWNALARKGLVKCEWPHTIALTPDGVAYDTGIADEILHMHSDH